MFEKVLIAEDHESASISVRKTLDDLGIKKPDYAYYCDDALLRIRKAIQASEPFELLITDLSFEEDKDRKQDLNDGQALIEAVRAIQPGIQILVFSAENRPFLVTELFAKHQINGYVRKARRDAQELKTALEKLAQNKKHFPLAFRLEISEDNPHAFTRLDIAIITQLAKGTLQKNIPAYLEEQNISPSGLSSIEKRLGLIKEALGFSNNEQLVAYCKDKHII